MQHATLASRIEELWALHAASPPVVSALALSRAGVALGDLLHADDAMPSPSLFVAPAGAVRADWARGDWRVTMVFGRSGSVEGEATNGRTTWRQAFDGARAEEDPRALLAWLAGLDGLSRAMPQATRADTARAWRRALGESERTSRDIDEGLEAVL